jgi:hypothetical protein
MAHLLKNLFDTNARDARRGAEVVNGQFARGQAADGLQTVEQRLPAPRLLSTEVVISMVDVWPGSAVKSTSISPEPTTPASALPLKARLAGTVNVIFSITSS